MGDIFNKQKKRDIPLNVLLVDDNAADVKIAVRAFEHAKLKNRLYLAGNGQECLDFVTHQGAFQDAAKYPRPDLILLDISMPVMDGFGVLDHLKKDPEYAAIPIVVLTGSNNEEDIRRSYRSGANSFIRKPVAYEEFVELVDAVNFYWHLIVSLPGKKDRVK